MQEIVSKNSLVGYISYSFVNFLEKLSCKRLQPFYDLEMIICDKKLRLKLINYEFLLNSIKKTINNIPHDFKTIKLFENKDRISFEKDVEKAKRYIEKGEIFQVVISRRYEISYNGNLIKPFLNLLLINPSPYMYYMKFGDRRIVGTSPETLFSIKQKRIETYPIAGTRHRSFTESDNKKILKELLKSQKDYAEHSMLVDLARNDVGKIAKFGTVKVSFYRKIKTFSHVHHIVSKVVGKLKEEVDLTEVLKALFPAGTVTGAPKIRAMEIIEKIEKDARGPYAGAVGILSTESFTDLAITIRSIISHENLAYIQAGAGIVYDSNPTLEYYETEQKMKACLEAMNIKKELALT